MRVGALFTRLSTGADFTAKVAVAILLAVLLADAVALLVVVVVPLGSGESIMTENFKVCVPFARRLHYQHHLHLSVISYQTQESLPYKLYLMEQGL